MRIIFIGPPGTGKGTQSNFITNKYSIPTISVGDILRSNTTQNNEYNKKINDIINEGKLVDDNTIVQLTKKRIHQIDCRKGFVLDGFPRTIPQAHALKNMNIKIDYVIQFELSYKLIIDRIKGRRIHIPSGRIYHKKYNPPKKENIDDITGQKLTVRKDDNEEKINKRIEEYQKYTLPLAEYYKKEEQLGYIKYYIINAQLTPLIIHKQLEKIFIQ
ncbi:adenylate kinase [Buchnera aphidicola]|uniref:adenylate kinase n=1 Tax=Buchnera aphidicola TaxID=9 RepID=UPI0031B84FE1